MTNHHDPYEKAPTDGSGPLWFFIPVTFLLFALLMGVMALLLDRSMPGYGVWAMVWFFAALFVAMGAAKFLWRWLFVHSGIVLWPGRYRAARDALYERAEALVTSTPLGRRIPQGVRNIVLGYLLDMITLAMLLMLVAVIALIFKLVS